MWAFNQREHKVKVFFKLLGMFLVKISHDVFIVSVFSWLFFLAVENFKTGLISNYFDLNLLLAVIAASGLITLLFYEERHFWKFWKPKGHSSYVLAVFAGLLVWFFAWSFFKSQGLMGLLLGLLFALLSIIIITLYNDTRS